MSERPKNYYDSSTAHAAAIKNAKLQELNGAYYQTLEESLGRLIASGVVTFPSGRPLRVLEIGCGNAEALPAILSYFGRLPLGEIGLDVSYTGVDIVEPKPASFRGIHGADNLRASAHFITGDARNLDSLLNNAEPFDVIIFRTPQVQIGVGEVGIAGHYTQFKPNLIFAELFDEAFRHLSPSGVVVASTQYGIERQMLRTMVAQRGTLLLEGTSSVTSGKFHVNDDYLIVAGPKDVNTTPIRLAAGQVIQK